MGNGSTGSAPTQGMLWGAEAAQRDKLQAGFVRPLWEAMLQAVGLHAGSRFFDAGCGSGNASQLVIERGCKQVTGLDAAESMIAIARERIPQGKFVVGDLEHLPFSDGEFDTIIACNSVHFTAHPLQTLKELRRVCAPGGKVAVASLGDPKECDASRVNRAALALLSEPPQGNEFTYPFRISDPGVLDGLMKDAGFKLVGDGKIDCPMSFPDVETAWTAQRTVGLHQAIMKVVGEPKLREALTRVFESLRTPDGGVVLKNRFRYIAATP